MLLQTPPTLDQKNLVYLPDSTQAAPRAPS